MRITLHHDAKGRTKKNPLTPNEIEILFLIKLLRIMKKRFYGALILGSLLLTGGMVTSCSDYDDDINSLSGRVDALEKTVADLKAAIEGGSVITNVQSTANGVTVTLSDGKTFEVKNGTNGTNGTPGSIVEIGDNGNWFIDGVDTGNPARGEKGDTGDTGANGQPGTNGKDGCWYMPNEDGYWHKQYYGEDGTVVDEATENKWTASTESVVRVVYDTENGRLLISNAEGMQEGEVVLIETAGELKSLAVIPYVIDKETSMPVVSFYNIVKNGKVLESTDATAHYRLNPNNANTKDWEWSIIDRKAVTRADGDNVNDLLTISDITRADGEMIVSLKSEKSIADLNKDEIAIFALNGTNTTNGNNIASDYAKVTSKDLKNFAIVDASIAPEQRFEEPYPTEIANIKDANAEFVYTEEIDLNKLVLTWAKDIDATSIGVVLDKEGLNIDGLTYEFTKPEKYLGSDGITNQQDFITLADGVVSVNNARYPNGEAAIGRTPIIEVTAKVNGESIASAYIKLSIVREAQVPQTPLVVYVSEEPIQVEYSSIVAGKAVQGFTWDRMNSEVYDALKLSREQFIEKYTKNEPTIEYKDVNGKNVNGVIINRHENEAGSTTTNVLDLELDPTLLPSSVTGTATITYTPENTLTDRPIQIVFKYAVSHKHVSYPEFNSQFVDVNKALATIKGQMINGTWTQKVEISEHFLLDSYKAEGNHQAPVLVVDEEKLPAGTKYTLTGTTLWNQVLTLDSEIEGDELNIPVNVVIALDNKDRICVKSYTIRFVNPLRLTPASIELTAPFPGRSDEKDITFVVKDTEGRVIITNGKATADNIYGITDDMITVTYSEGEDWSTFGINNDNTQKLTLNESKPSIKWENKGTALAEPVNTTYKVQVKVNGIAIMAKSGNVTVKETDM